MRSRGLAVRRKLYNVSHPLCNAMGAFTLSGVWLMYCYVLRGTTSMTAMSPLIAQD